jgi:hypothetical protein
MKSASPQRRRGCAEVAQSVAEFLETAGEQGTAFFLALSSRRASVSSLRLGGEKADQTNSLKKIFHPLANQIP